MRELSLFSGTCGGVLGTLLLGWEHIGYVERDDYCQRVIAQRIKDGILPAAPIFTDMRLFLESGAAAEYRGFADVVTAGWPCQPHSTAGKRLGTADDREGWPFVIETIRIVKPRWFLGENVPGILSTDAGRYFGTIQRDLAESGYDCRWRILSAAELGAPHQRDRLWIVAYTNNIGHEKSESHQSRDNRQGNTKTSQQARRIQPGEIDCGSELLGNSTIEGLPNGQHEAMGRSSQGTPVMQPQRSSWWATEPDVGRMVNGVASRVDRLRAIGNGQVPIVAATAWHLLTEGLDL